MSEPAGLRVGVVGAGVMGTDHALTLGRFVRGAEVSRVADLDLERATAAVEQLPGAEAGQDPVALVHDDAVDAVVVASADATHAALVLECIAAGKPVMCEKPLAPTVQECRRVVEAEREHLARSGLPLVSLGFMRRFDPGYVAMKEHLQAGRCGAPVLVHCVSRGVASGPGATSELSITGSAVHELDTVPWLLGSRIRAVGWHAPSSVAPGDLQDPQVLLLHTDDGVLTTVEVFLNAGYGYDIRCELVGTEGTVALTEPARTVADATGMRATSYAGDWRPRFADAYRLQLQAWVDAARSGTPAPLATAVDGLRAAVASDTAIQAMRAGDGRPVVVPQVEEDGSAS